MKKLLVAFCAFGLVSFASAQTYSSLKNAPMEVKSSASSVVLNQENSLNAAKATAFYDTIDTEPMYRSEYMSIMGGEISSGTWMWYYGTYWLNFLWGTGEIGYTYDFSSTGFYELVLQKQVKGWYLTGGGVYISRMAGLADSMPLYMKAYVNEAVVPQTVINEYGSTNATTSKEVVYPYDPEMGIESNTVKVPHSQLDASNDNFPEPMFVKLSFVPAIKIADDCDYIALSTVFPHDNPTKDSIWNATTLVATNSSSSTVKSTLSDPVFIVADWTVQEMWIESEDGPAVREKPEWAMDLDGKQTNDRYSVLSHSSWVFTNGIALDGEPMMKAFFSTSADIESPNKYDIRVNVSPIPATDKVTFSSYETINTIEIYSLNGGLVKKVNANAQDVDVVVSGFGSGMYIAKVYTTGGMATKKIVVR